MIEGIGESTGSFDSEIDGNGLLLTPGLVDAHTHLCFCGSRSWEFEARINGATYQDLAARGGGIAATVRSVHEASKAELVRSTERHAWWCLKHGTTTVEAKSGYGLTYDQELRILQAYREQSTPLTIIPTLLAAHAMPAGQTREAHIEMIVHELGPEVKREGLAKYVDIFVEHGYFSGDDARRLQTLGMPFRLHVDQLRDGSGAALAAELHAVTADHLEHTNEPGIRALKASGTHPVLLPGSVYGLGLSRYPDARAMLELGLPVVIATDFNAGSSPTASLPMAMSLACLHMKMTPKEVWEATTRNAAKSLGVFDEVGSIDKGKRADLVLWDTDDYRDVPFHFGTNLVKKVWKHGELIVEN